MGDLTVLLKDIAMRGYPSFKASEVRHRRHITIGPYPERESACWRPVGGSSIRGSFLLREWARRLLFVVHYVVIFPCFKEPYVKVGR